MKLLYEFGDKHKEGSGSVVYMSDSEIRTLLYLCDSSSIDSTDLNKISRVFKNAVFVRETLLGCANELDKIWIDKKE